MISLLIAVGGLFLAVFASAILDPGPQPPREEGDDLPTIDATTLPI